MIVFDLQCRDGGETFEAWFRSNADYEEQRGAGLVECPFCQSANIAKAPMAPRVPAKGSGNPLARLAAMQSEMLKDSRWVGDRFADTARAIHSGDPWIRHAVGHIMDIPRVEPVGGKHGVV